MMQVTFQNQPVTISGNLPKVGDKAPDFCLCTASLEGVKVLCISEDLPFAADRFCTAAGIKNVMTLSDFRKDGNFGENYGVMIKDSALRGLLTRSIFVIDKEGKIAYVELVPEITNEPNYAAAIETAKKCL